MLAHVLADGHGVGRGAEEDVAILPRVDGATVQILIDVV